MDFNLGEKLRWKDDVARFDFLLQYLAFATEKHNAEDAVKLVRKYHTMVGCNTVWVIGITTTSIEVQFEGETIKLPEHELERWFQHIVRE